MLNLKIVKGRFHEALNNSLLEAIVAKIFEYEFIALLFYSGYRDWSSYDLRATAFTVPTAIYNSTLF